MAANNSLEGLTLGFAATGGMSSLGWNILSHLVLSSDLTRNGILGSKDGISKICIYNRNPGKTSALTKQMFSLIGWDPEKEKAQDDAGNQTLCTRIENKAFAIEKCEDIAEIANSTDVILIGYDTVPGIERKNALKATSARIKSLNSNMPVLYSWQKAFENYNGLMVFLTNPSDYMTYFGIDILGLDKDQVVGLDHVDTFRLRDEFKYLYSALEELAGRQLSTEEKSIAINALSELNDYTAFMIGNHSADSLGLFSNITCGKSNTPWNQIPVLSDEKVKKGIISLIHKKARELSEVIDGPNANCIPPIIDVIKGIVTGEGVFEMAYYLEIESKLQKKIKAKYDADIAGVCTGVPVIFTKDGKKRRAEMADKFRADSHKVKFPGATKEEKAKFEGILERNASQIAEATVLKNKEGAYRFLEENNLLVIHTLLSSNLLVYETKKDALSGDTNLMYPKKKSTLNLQKPEIKAVAANNNRLIIIQPEGKVILKEFPNRNLESLTDENTDTAKEVELGSIHSSVRLAAMHDDDIYLADSKRIEKRTIANFNKPNVTEKTLDVDIWSIYADSNGALCACSEGEIKEFNTQLSEIRTYTSKENKSKMIKVKRIEFNDKKYIFALNANGSIHMWNPKETETAPQIKSTRACFDVQVETDGKKEFICVYHVGAKDTIEITRICPETEVLETTTTDITCSSDIKDIQAEGNEVYFVSNNRVRSFLNKETPNMDVPLPEQFINKIVHIHYKK